MTAKKCFRVGFDFETDLDIDCLDIRDDIVHFIQEQEYGKSEGIVSLMKGKKIIDCEYWQIPE